MSSHPEQTTQPINPHCRIGRVRPKLRAVEGNVAAIDPWDDAGVVEDLINVMRVQGNVKAYTVTIVHENNTVTRTTQMRPGSLFQLVGALTCEISMIVAQTREV